MGSDQRRQLLRGHPYRISIHAPRMGSDITNYALSFCWHRFQSTLPAWGATNPKCVRSKPLVISIHAPRMGSDNVDMNITNAIKNFNPRSPHGERPFIGYIVTRIIYISIHAPRMGSDSTVKAYSNDRIKWSTLREPHFLYSKNACFSPIVSMCAATSRTKNQRIRVSFGSYPGLAPTCFTLDWYRFPRL